MATLQEIHDFWVAMPEESPVIQINGDGKWKETTMSPVHSSCIENFRWISGKIIDMSELVNSGIDCLFWDDDLDVKVICLLIGVDTEAEFCYNSRIVYFKKCAPRYDRWFSKADITMPGRAKGESHTREVEEWLTGLGFTTDTDIRSDAYFRISGVLPGFRYRWDDED